ncbi:MAG: hypothetical protein E6I16_09090 [Chloroflexi bacterium]|nr:MAG: hypothetical protein E6I16_09090 [Chloroflexota bacterium]
MDLLRAMLSVFAMLNAAGWAALALAWAFRPDWAERLPLQLGTHQRYLKAAPVWARLAAALTGFWTLAAMLYLTAGHNTAPLIVIALFTTAAAFLIIAIAAATAVFRALQPDPLPLAPESGQQAF